MIPQTALSLGRGVIVTAGAAAPPPWADRPRVLIDEAVVDAPEATVDRLHRLWRERTPVVVEIAVPVERLRTTEVERRPPWELDAGFTFALERLYFLARANNYDARTGRLRWWPAELATRLGATSGGDAGGDGARADVVLANATPAWVDGGPRGTGRVPDGHVIVHRSTVESGSLRADRTGAVHDDLAPDQLAAVAPRGGSARVIAPAGSGKTRVLTARLRHLVADRHWDGVVAVAYNVRAQEEMGRRLTDVAGAARAVRTLNSFAFEILREHRPVHRVIDEREVRERVGRHLHLRPRRDTDVVAPFLDALTEVRLGLRDPKDVEDQRGDVDGLAEMLPRYRGELEADGVTDFDDQIVGAIEALCVDAELRARVRARWRHLLVDEFQDLTPAHVLLLRLVAAPTFEVFGVGDDDQVIYGYNGADPDFLIRYGHYFPGAEEHVLTVNYRCPPEIVDAAATLLTHNRKRVEKNVHAFRTDRRADALVVRSAAADALPGATTDQVREWLAGGAPAHEIAVLARVNATLLGPQVLLADAGVATTMPIGETILQRTGVRAALAYLRIATAAATDRPFSGADIGAVAGRPSRKIPRPVRDAMARRRAWTSSALRDRGRQDSGNTAAGLMVLADDVERLGRIAHEQGTSTAVLRAVRDLLAEALGALDRSGRGPEQSHLDDLDALVALAGAHEDPATYEPWLRGHLRERPADGPVVTLASVHKVKGREWDHVVLLGAHDGLLPHRLATDVEEERRVFHVAITRARAGAVLLADAGHPAPFVEEMREPFDPTRPPRIVRRPAVDGRAPSAAGPPAATPPDSPLFDALKAWRRERARADHVPAYVVLHDRHLGEIARRRPRTLAELGRCPGIGPAKLDRYGDDLLAIVDAAPPG